MRVPHQELHALMSTKMQKAGLTTEHADIVADVLLHADLRGVHSHGAMRVEYYAERISKGGTTIHPNFTFTETGPCSAILDGDNGAGHVIAKVGMEKAIEMAAKNGIAVVGMRRMGHSGALSYFVQQAAKAGYIGLSVCQSDPMAVPYGGAEPFYGTNPIAFCAPSADGRMATVDLAVTVQAWGKVLHARSRKEPIPATWAVDKEGHPTTDPFNVGGLVHISDAKGYALALMIDVLAGVLLGVPFGNKVSSMYSDLTAGRELGQLHLVIDPARFTDKEAFLTSMSTLMNDINNVKPAPGFDRVLFPGQSSAIREADQLANGVNVVEDIYNYLVSDTIHNNAYEGHDAFAG